MRPEIGDEPRGWLAWLGLRRYDGKFNWAQVVLSAGLGFIAGIIFSVYNAPFLMAAGIWLLLYYIMNWARPHTKAMGKKFP